MTFESFHQLNWQPMNHTDIATWDVLLDFGFEPDTDRVSGSLPRLSFDFGDLKLSACCLINLQFAEVVSFSGVLTTQRTAADVCFDLPRRVRSREQCAARIIYYLNKAANGGAFHPTREAGWVSEGRQNQNLLPWIVDSASYRARPCCIIQRDCLRAALKTLAEILATSQDEAEVVFGFDGSVLRSDARERPWRCREKVRPGAHNIHYRQSNCGSCPNGL